METINNTKLTIQVLAILVVAFTLAAYGYTMYQH